MALPRILVIDRDEDVLTLMYSCMRDAGYEVQLARDHHEAVSWIRSGFLADIVAARLAAEPTVAEVQFRRLIDRLSPLTKVVNLADLLAAGPIGKVDVGSAGGSNLPLGVLRGLTQGTEALRKLTAVRQRRPAAMPTARQVSNDVYRSARANLFLSALPDRDRMALLGKARVMYLRAGRRLNPGVEAAGRVFFPLAAVISLGAGVPPAPVFQVAAIGTEGLSGMSTALRAAGSSVSETVLVGGPAIEVDAGILRREAEARVALAFLVSRVLQGLLQQAAQIAACSGTHTVRQRLARWLLATFDRTNQDRFPVRQQVMADQIGARRPTVNAVVRQFEEARLIEQDRGAVVLLDREGLRAEACGCYSAISLEREAMMAGLRRSGRF